MNAQRMIALALTALLLFPFLFLFLQFPQIIWPDFGEVYWAFKNSFNQAFLSALISLFSGCIGALGLLKLDKSRMRLWVECICLIPNFIPPLFVLLAVLNIVHPFPMGVIGIVIIHSFINFGLSSVLIARAIESRAGGVIELAYVEGASRGRLFLTGILPLLRRDLAQLFLFIFILCFASFSVPLIVGGGTGTTLEVLIYERIRLSADWGQAVFIAAIQSLFILAISMVIHRTSAPLKRATAHTRSLGSYGGLIAIALFSFVFLFGYGRGVVQGLSYLSTFEGMSGTIVQAFFNSIYMGLSVGLLSLVGLVLCAYVWPLKWFEKFLNGYMAPSTALACFSFLVFGGNAGWMPFLKIPLVLTILSLTSLYRLAGASALQSLERQFTVARSMGAGHNQIFSKIILPQVLQTLGLLSGLGAVWACGDFAVSRILAHSNLTVGMLTETLMSTYRLSQATVLSLLLIVAAFICFLVIWGGSRVAYKKLVS